MTKWILSADSGIPITVTQPDDPAYALLLDPHTSTSTVYKRGCYICEDPEFAAMGLPLCNSCGLCGGHVAADNVECDDCGADQEMLYHWHKEGTGPSPYEDLCVDACWP